MTRKNTATAKAPKGSKKHRSRVKQAKVNKLTRGVLANLGNNPFLYGENPPKPNVVKVDLRLIRFDESYQRPKQLGLIRKIALAFQYGSLGMPVVVQREDGFFYAIDGQQRITALREINKIIPGFMTHIWCEVVLEKDAKAIEEAKIFIGRNRRANMALLSTFKAEYRAKDRQAVDIIRKMSAKGLSLEGINIKGALYVKCVSAIRWAHRHGVLDDTIDAIKATWGLVPTAFQVKVFAPIAVLIQKNRNCIGMKGLVAALSTTTPAGLDAQAGSTNGRMRTVNIANFIVGRYNKSVPKAQRLDRVGSSDI